MRRLLLFTALAVLVGCGANQPESTVSTARPDIPVYASDTFRADVTRLIEERRYAVATTFVKSVDPKKQAAFDGAGYLAVAGYLVFLPGLDGISYDRSRDWVFPGTSDVLEDGEWQDTAFEFAKQYNLYRGRK